MRSLLLLFLIHFSLPAQEKWPDRFQAPQPAMKELLGKEGLAAWETRHFILACEVEIPRTRLQDLARVAESIPLLFRSLPIPLWAPPEEEKPVIRICKDETSFVARGGPVGAAGYYHGRQAVVLIRGDLLLNPPQAQATRLQVGPDGDLLVHELSHLAMHRYGILPPWLAEGLAEYFASCHLGKGSFEFFDSARRIPQHIRKFYPVERFPTVELPPLQRIATVSPKDWVKTNNAMPPEDRYRSYAASLLLAHYYLEGGEKRRLELSTYFQDKRIQMETRSRTPPTLSAFPKDVEEKLIAYWKTKGLAIRFARE